MPVADLASLADEMGLGVEELAKECDPDGAELRDLFEAFGVHAAVVKMKVKAQLRTLRSQHGSQPAGGGGGGDGSGGGGHGGGGGAVQVQLPDGSSYTLRDPTKLTNQDYVRRVLDQVKIGLEPLVDFACRTRGLQKPTDVAGRPQADAMYLQKHVMAHTADYAAVLRVDNAQMKAWVQAYIQSPGPAASRRGLLPLRHAVSHQLKDRYTHQEVDGAIGWAEGLCQAVATNGAGLDGPAKTAAGAAHHNLVQLRRQYAQAGGDAPAAAGPALPPGWVQYFDKREGVGTFGPFYAHLQSGRSQWHRPAGQAAGTPPPPPPPEQAPVVRDEARFRQIIELDHVVIRDGLVQPLESGGPPEYCLLLATPHPRLLRRARGGGGGSGGRAAAEVSLVGAVAKTSDKILSIEPAAGGRVLFECADGPEADGWRVDILRLVGEDQQVHPL